MGELLKASYENDRGKCARRNATKLLACGFFDLYPLRGRTNGGAADRAHPTAPQIVIWLTPVSVSYVGIKWEICEPSAG
jgi:hypothetical protein